MRRMICSIAAALCILTGCSKEIKVVPTEVLTVEYGDELDQSKLFDAKASDQGVKVEKVTGFDSKKVGEQTLRVLFAIEGTEVEKEIKVVIKDTKKPTIKLKKDKITITMGDEINLRDNVKTVTDPVDGKLPYSKKEIKKSGFYIDQGKLDLKKAGTYEVKVNAFDANGNKSEKAFDVVVKKKPKKKAAVSDQPAISETDVQEKQQSSQASNGETAPATGSGNQSTKPKDNAGTSTKQPEKPAEPAQCVSDGNFGRLGNSGMVFIGSDAKDAKVKASAWADEQLNYGEGPWGVKGYNGYYAWSVFDNCGERNDVWTVDFYK